eukprot:TRINITY_DN5079_c0_g6_i1.p1 TRINITY_DN5079_c0_g6~~TRINITY_DN5079_c0_g6_i1.p1  ORF type:complete len:453 (+),score=122.77 TRINITY_DN5079_c0_g6_i1:694-2052(+)
MKSKGCYFLDSETTYVIERLDKDKDGRVTYIDFLESLTAYKDQTSEHTKYWTTMTEPRGRLRAGYETLAKSAKVERGKIRCPEDEFRPFSAKPNTPLKKIGERKEFLIKPKEKHEDSPLKIEDLEIIRKRHEERKEYSVINEETKSERVASVLESALHKPTVAEVEVQTDKPKSHLENIHLVKESEQDREELKVESDERFMTPAQPPLKSPECPTTGETPLGFGLRDPVDPELLKAREELLAKLLKDQLFIDKFTEEARERLYARPDFSTKEAFKLFSGEKGDTVSLFELKWGLKKLGVHTRNEELITMTRRYDLNKDGKLSYEEFEAMLKSESKVEKDSVEDKEFGEITKCLLKSLMTSIIENEVKIERIRNDIGRYAELKHLYLENTFNDLDKAKKGFITIEELTKLMQRTGNYMTSKEAELIMKRYDKDCDGRISFAEFLHEVAPTLVF